MLVYGEGGRSHIEPSGPIFGSSSAYPRIAPFPHTLHFLEPTHMGPRWGKGDAYTKPMAFRFQADLQAIAELAGVQHCEARVSEDNQRLAPCSLKRAPGGKGHPNALSFWTWYIFILLGRPKHKA